MLILETSLDVAGVVDPTPASDLAAAGLALSRGDLWSAGLNLLCTVPYAGDAVGKPIKASRTAVQVKRLHDKVSGLVKKMAQNPALEVTAEAAKSKARPPGAGSPSARPSVALTDKGTSQLGRGLPLPPGATDFRGWRGKRVIDSGAGGGSFVRELRSQGVDAYGFDIVSDSFKKAGVKRNDHFVQASADRIPMGPGTFDAATSNWSVFYYFERGVGDRKTATYLAELSRVVKPGGEIRLFGVDPRAVDVIRRFGKVTVEEVAPATHGSIPFVRLRVRGGSGYRN